MMINLGVKTDVYTNRNIGNCGISIPSSDRIIRPSIVFTPDQNQWVQSKTYTLLAGTVAIDSGTVTGVQISLNGGAYSAVDNFTAPNWSMDSVTLEENDNTINIKATSDLGIEKVSSFTINADTIDPVITMPDDISPNPGTGFNVVLTTANWTETNPDVVRYKIEGGVLAGSWVNWSAPYADATIAVPADTETYTITLEVTDLSGRSASAEQSIGISEVVEDVFSAYLYDGTGAALDIVNGINGVDFDVAIGLKDRTSSSTHNLYDSVRGRGVLNSDSTAAALPEPSATQGLTSYNVDGFSLGTELYVNNNRLGHPYVSWAFREAPNFFQIASVSLGTGDEVIDLSSLGVVGMVAVKRTDNTGSWYIWHIGLTSGKLLYLEQTAAETTDGSITVSGTNLTLVDGTLTDGDYSIYAWAHDTSDTGMIQCGSFTTDASGNASVDHGWTAGLQLVDLKASSTTGDWERFDTARTPGWTGDDARLRPNLPNIEDTVTRLSESGTTVSFTGLSASQTYVYTFIVAPTI